jgi:hypothetical protein
MVIRSGNARGVGIGYSVNWPVVWSMRPILFVPVSVNQTFPSEPAVMPAGPECAGSANSCTSCVRGPIRPTRSASSSVNHSEPPTVAIPLAPAWA